jgi:hypothetical protein
MRRRILVTLTILAMFALAAPAAASPSTDNLLSRQARSAAELQAQIDLQLERFPGGTQTAPNEVTYGNGRFVVTYAMPGMVRPMGVADCPVGWFCFYEYTNYGYPRGSLRDKGWQDLANWGWHDRTESVHNATDTSVDFQNHTSGGHGNDQYLFCVLPFGGKDSDVSPYRSMADHVVRYYDSTFC